MEIVVGFVDTVPGRHALKAATAQARAHGGRLHVIVHVGSEVGEHAAQVREFDEGAAEAAGRLDTVVDELAADGLDVTGEVLRDHRGSAGEAIVDYASQCGADLVVVGVRQRSKVGKLLLGSDLQDVILSAPCSVLAAKSTDPPG